MTGKFQKNAGSPPEVFTGIVGGARWDGRFVLDSVRKSRARGEHSEKLTGRGARHLSPFPGRLSRSSGHNITRAGSVGPEPQPLTLLCAFGQAKSHARGLRSSGTAHVGPEEPWRKPATFAREPRNRRADAAEILELRRRTLQHRSYGCIPEGIERQSAVPPKEVSANRPMNSGSARDWHRFGNSVYETLTTSDPPVSPAAQPAKRPYPPPILTSSSINSTKHRAPVGP